MAFNKKLTLIRGGKRESVAIANGTDIAGGGDDAIEINIDATNMTRGECVEMIDVIRDRIIQGLWPIA